MGSVTNQSRLQFLTVRLHDLDMNAQQISEQKSVLAAQAQNASMNMNLSSMSGIAMGGQSDAVEWQLDGENAQIEDFDFDFDMSSAKDEVNQQAYDEKMQEISEQEKLLDMQMLQIKMEREAVSTEYDSVKNLIKTSVV